MKINPFRLSPGLLALGLTAIVTGSAQATVLFNENFNESSFVGNSAYATAVGGGTTTSNPTGQLAPVVGSWVYLQGYDAGGNPNTVSITAGTPGLGGSAQGLLFTAPTTAAFQEVLWNAAPIASETSGQWTYSYDFRLGGNFSGANAALIQTALGSEINSQLQGNGANAFDFSGTNFGGSATTSAFSLNLGDTYHVAYNLNLSTATYGITVFDATTSSSVASFSGLGINPSLIAGGTSNLVGRLETGGQTADSTIEFDNMLFASTAVPEPSSFALLGLGAAVAVLIRGLRRRPSV